MVDLSHAVEKREAPRFLRTGKFAQHSGRSLIAGRFADDEHSCVHAVIGGDDGRKGEALHLGALHVFLSQYQNRRYIAAGGSIVKHPPGNFA